MTYNGWYAMKPNQTEPNQTKPNRAKTLFNGFNPKVSVVGKLFRHWDAPQFTVLWLISSDKKLDYLMSFSVMILFVQQYINSCCTLISAHARSPPLLITTIKKSCVKSYLVRSADKYQFFIGREISLV